MDYILALPEAPGGWLLLGMTGLKIYSTRFAKPAVEANLDNAIKNISR